jgi:hypothetical protein
VDAGAGADLEPDRRGGPFGMSIGMRCGLTRRGPFSRRTSFWLSSVSAPPMPEPMTTASRVGLDLGAPASAHASRAATSATCCTRSSVPRLDPARAGR